MAEIIILRGDRPGSDRLVLHPGIEPGYPSPLPALLDEQRQTWQHADPEAWRRCLGGWVPVYHRAA
jgi:hypothetical protein